jgi:hypothetical protein
MNLTDCVLILCNNRRTGDILHLSLMPKLRQRYFLVHSAIIANIQGEHTLFDKGGSITRSVNLETRKVVLGIMISYTE